MVGTWYLKKLAQNTEMNIITDRAIGGTWY